ncbi:protein tyrosine phosphatase [Patescibacteria group bacterium]|nr:protein tyrosine phosphatase [Patescibacteria group bacterium]
MNKPKLLFVCTYNQWRSLTAEIIFKQDDRFEVKSAGTSKSAQHVISNKDVEWADHILCMENRHKEAIKDKFAGQSLPPINVMEIDSGYHFMDPELIEILKQRVGELELTK